MEHNSFSSVFILGVGGAGMNVLAQFLAAIGKKVYGTDRSFDQGGKERIKNILISKGVNILKETEIPNIPIDLFIKSPAIDESHPILVWGKKKGITLISRSDFLIRLFNKMKGIGVSGTSGKTTVTGMTAFVLNYTSPEYHVFCGDEIINYSNEKALGNYVKGHSEKIILELDESDRKLSKYHPAVTCITSVQKDHYPLNELEELFNSLIKHSSCLILNIDCPNLARMAKDIKTPFVTVSTKNPDADYYGEITNVYPTALEYLINGKPGILNLPGTYNLKNALMALAIGEKCGVSLKEGLKRLKGFQGIRNRFELKIKGNSFFVLDFAHNPEKIYFSLKSAKDLGLPVCYVFQPHGYGPLKLLQEEFAETFNKNLGEKDTLILLKVYDAGGKANRTIQSDDLLKLISHPNSYYFSSREEFINFWKLNNKEPSTCIISGARDDTLRELLHKLKQENSF